MAELVLLTADPGGAGRVLPSLALLRHRVALAPMTTSALFSNARADVLVIDGRLDLVSARALCRTAGTDGLLPSPVPVLLVLGEGGFAAVSGEWGTWDVVVQTAGPAEIDARVRLLLGRAGEPETDTDDAARIEAGDLVIDPVTYTARVRGRVLDLTFREFELLRHLASHPARVHTRAQLLQEVWGYEYVGGTRTVDVHVRRLRAKLGAEHDQVIGTVRNVGYRFDPRGAAGRPDESNDGVANPS